MFGIKKSIFLIFLVFFSVVPSIFAASSFSGESRNISILFNKGQGTKVLSSFILASSSLNPGLAFKAGMSVFSKKLKTVKILKKDKSIFVQRKKSLNLRSDIKRQFKKKFHQKKIIHVQLNQKNFFINKDNNDSYLNFWASIKVLEFNNLDSRYFYKSYLLVPQEKMKDLIALDLWTKIGDNFKNFSFDMSYLGLKAKCNYNTISKKKDRGKKGFIEGFDKQFSYNDSLSSKFWVFSGIGSVCRNTIVHNELRKKNLGNNLHINKTIFS